MAHLVRWEGVVLGLIAAAIIVVALRRDSLLPVLAFLAGLALFALPYGVFLYRNTGSVLSPKTMLTQLHAAAIDATASDKDLDYIRQDKRITDVVISSEQDAIENLYGIGKLIGDLREIHHVNAVRLRSLKFNYEPAVYTRAVIDRLGELNRLAVVNPLRLEIETQFLHSSEIEQIHDDRIKALHNKGITVYNNTPLLANINDHAEEIHRLAFNCRKIGLEFHHLYVAGLPLQKDWSKKHPIDISTVIDIATRVRKDGSGREIPRYIILTELGEVDFGLTSKLSEEKGRMALKLLPYTLDYFKGMDAAYDWPQQVRIDTDGKPILPVAGLANNTDFLMA